MNRGQVYVGKKGLRGVTGSFDPVIPGFLNINVTSGSQNKINGYMAKTLSPMLLGPVNEKEIFGITSGETALIFENYWQYGKIFRELGHVDDKNNLTIEWVNFRLKGYNKNKGDRHPIGTKSKDVKFVDEYGKNHYKYYTAIGSVYLNKFFDYVGSRKNIYAPIYAWLVSQTSAFIELKKLVDSGTNIQILDFDILPGSHPITVDFLRERINDPNYPFGHGYVIAGLLANISPIEYCGN